jgi:hypothetical protein
MVLSQATEAHRVPGLAKLVVGTTGGEIAFLPDPRVEAEKNDLAVRGDHFLAFGMMFAFSWRVSSFEAAWGTFFAVIRGTTRLW